MNQRNFHLKKKQKKQMQLLCAAVGFTRASSTHFFTKKHTLIKHENWCRKGPMSNIRSSLISTFWA